MRSRPAASWLALVLLLAIGQLAVLSASHAHARGQTDASSLCAGNGPDASGGRASAPDHCPLCSALAACSALGTGQVLALHVPVSAYLHTPGSPERRSSAGWTPSAPRGPPLSRA